MILFVDEVPWSSVPLDELREWCCDKKCLLEQLPHNWIARDAATELGFLSAYLSYGGCLLLPLARDESKFQWFTKAPDELLLAAARYQSNHGFIPVPEILARACV